MTIFSNEPPFTGADFITTEVLPNLTTNQGTGKDAASAMTGETISYHIIIP